MKLKSKVIGGLAGASLLGGVVFAGVSAASSASSIPATNGVITGCYKIKTGALSVIDAATTRCPSGSATLTWNQRGLTGARGATGAPGATGATGPRGATGATGARGAPGAAGATGATGPQGPAGPAGPQGAKGDTGAAGSAIAAGMVVPDGTTPYFSPQGEKGWKAVTTPQGEANGEYCLTPEDGINPKASTLQVSVLTYVASDASHPTFYGAIGSAVWEGYCDNGGFLVLTFYTGYTQGNNVAFEAVIP